MYSEPSCSQKRKLHLDLLPPKRQRLDEVPLHHDIYEHMDGDALQYQFLATHSSEDLYYRTAIRKLIERRIEFDGRAVVRGLVDSVGRYGAHPHDLVKLDQLAQEEIAVKLARLQVEFTSTPHGVFAVIEDLLRTLPNPRDTLRSLGQSFGCKMLDEHMIKQEEAPDSLFDIDVTCGDGGLETPVIDLLTGPVSSSNPTTFSAFEDLAQSMDRRLKSSSGCGTVRPLICEVIGQSTGNSSIPLRFRLDLALRPLILDYPKAFPELQCASFVKKGAGGVRTRGIANLHLLSGNKRQQDTRNFSPTPIVDLLIGEHRHLDPRNSSALGYEFMGLLRDRFALSSHTMRADYRWVSGRRYDTNTEDDSRFCRRLSTAIKVCITEHDRRAGVETVLRPFVLAHRELFPELDYYIFPPI